MIKDSGSCYCGKIKFDIWDFNPTYSVCHCTECCKWTGSFYACIAAKADHYKIQGQENITWYAKSADSEQGFCKNCGSAIFWRQPKNPTYLDFAIGFLDNPKQLTAKRHIFSQTKPDYYDFPNDGAPRFDERG